MCDSLAIQSLTKDDHRTAGMGYPIATLRIAARRCSSWALNAYNLIWVLLVGVSRSINYLLETVCNRALRSTRTRMDPQTLQSNMIQILFYSLLYTNLPFRSVISPYILLRSPLVCSTARQTVEVQLRRVVRIDGYSNQS